MPLLGIVRNDFDYRVYVLRCKPKCARTSGWFHYAAESTDYAKTDFRVNHSVKCSKRPAAMQSHFDVKCARACKQCVCV